MAWQNVKLNFLMLLYMWICSQASLEVDVNCWWNRAHPVGHNVSVVCHTSARGRAKSCDLFQLCVITPGQRHLLPSTCVSAKETFNFSIAIKHTGHIRCMCNGKTSDTCNLTVRGGYPPSSPSRPDCAIENSDEDLDEDIHCSWTKSNEPMIPTIYTLHWKDCDGNINSRESDQEKVVIIREEYMKSTDITAWVTAKNVLGSAQSEESIFNTGHIIRPEPPKNITYTFMPLVIYWNWNDCGSVGPLDNKCQVQYRARDHMLDWIQEDDFQSTFPLEDSQPFTEYLFRLRCHCGYEENVMSNWSSVFSVTTPPAAPVGQLDVWSDCAPYSDYSCNIYWKKMPPSQARGEISNYIVTLKLKNGTEIKQFTRQQSDTGNQHRTEQNCPQLICFPLKMGVVGVFVSANTSLGTSVPTFMPFPVRGQTTTEVYLSVTGEKQTLRVSWSVHPQFFDSVLEYVVQYVSVPHRPCLSWVRVNGTQTFVTITGDFRNYTAYNVSLYAVFNNHSTFLKSAIAYTLQGVPPKVPQFLVKIISHSSVILMWSPFPVHESKGVILHYLVGINESGYKVSSDRTSMHLSDLQPSRQYQAWVSAVSAAGEGMRSITTFSTPEENSYFSSIMMAVFIPLSFLILVIAFKWVLLRYCFQKIPDPLNSKSFKYMNFQHAWPWLCSPSETPLKICELEIVENLHPNTPSSPSETELEQILIDVEPPHFQVPDGLGRTNVGGEKWLEDSEESNRRNISKQDSWRKEYSEMVDTDEEEGAGGEEWWDQQLVSDYERHFMPSVEVN